VVIVRYSKAAVAINTRSTSSCGGNNVHIILWGMNRLREHEIHRVKILQSRHKPSLGSGASSISFSLPLTGIIGTGDGKGIAGVDTGSLPFAPLG
jgi:hypothetical protein